MADFENPDFWMDSYNGFTAIYQRIGAVLPTQNPDIPGKRHLDCAFFDYFKVSLSEQKSIGAIRSAFVEGKRIFPDSAICDKTHVQIAIANVNLIE